MELKKKLLQELWKTRPEFSLSSNSLYLESKVNENTYIQIWASQEKKRFGELLLLEMRVVQGWAKLENEQMYCETAELANREVLRFIYINTPF
jgi:hypothetical protein